MLKSCLGFHLFWPWVVLGIVYPLGTWILLSKADGFDPAPQGRVWWEGRWGGNAPPYPSGRCANDRKHRVSIINRLELYVFISSSHSDATCSALVYCAVRHALDLFILALDLCRTLAMVGRVCGVSFERQRWGKVYSKERRPYQGSGRTNFARSHDVNRPHGLSQHSSPTHADCTGPAPASEVCTLWLADFQKE